MWYWWQSIFLAFLYLANILLSTLSRLIQITLKGRRALAVPLRLPNPVWRPFAKATSRLCLRLREWTALGFLMMSLLSIILRMVLRELASWMSEDSLGSSPTGC